MRCQYRDCQRAALPGVRMCAAHGSASGLNRAQHKRLQNQKARRKAALDARHRARQQEKGSE